MVHLSKIYTRTGDNGITSTASGENVAKSSLLIEAIGAIDEANSAIGIATEFGSAVIDRIQSDLFDLGAELSGAPTINISENRVTYLEKIIDDYNKNLEPLNSFVLPTGLLHNARAIVRRAEREVWKLAPLNENIPRYLNRLSDLLFVMARYNNKGNEKLWVPKT